MNSNSNTNTVDTMETVPSTTETTTETIVTITETMKTIREDTHKKCFLVVGLL